MDNAQPGISDLSDALARTARTRRGGLVLAMFAAPWLIVVAETGHSIANPQGTDDVDRQSPSGWSRYSGKHWQTLGSPCVSGCRRTR